MTSKQFQEDKEYPRRTARQNRALHKLFGLMAENLNEAGLDMKRTLKPGVDIPWTPEAVKQYLWKPVQAAQLQKTSTTELTTVEIDKVFDTLNKHLGEKFSLHTPWPSIEELMIEKQSRERAQL